MANYGPLLLLICALTLSTSSAMMPRRTQEIIVHQEEHSRNEAAREHDLPFADAVSYKLDAGHTNVTEVGEQMDLWARLPGETAEFVSCTWTLGSTTYTVDPVSGTITPDTPEVEVVAEDPRSCHISILELKEEQLGDWVCKVQHTASAVYQEAILAIYEEDPITANFRLPRTVLPSHYRLWLTPVLEGEFPIYGRAVIEARAGEPTESITLHVNNMTIDEEYVLLTDEDGDVVPVVGHAYDAARQFYIIRLGSSINGPITIDITYEAILNDLLAGFYRSNYVEGNETKVLGSTQFQATDARRAFPCFDEPDMKAEFTVSLGRKDFMSSISNMPPTETGAAMEGSNTYVWDHYQKTVVMPTYLLAFVVSEFHYRGEDVNFRIWTRNGLIYQTEYAATTGPAIQAFFEEYFDIPYPLPKQDQIGIPDVSFGAMENWGLITYRESLLLYEEGVSSVQDRIRVAEIQSHELAHQWFGNLVTMEWWNDLWLNEGFASYCEQIGADFIEPNASVSDLFPLDKIHPTFDVDALETSHPIQVDVYHPDEINEIFDSITYLKGSSVINMAANFMGVDVFTDGVIDYLKTYNYSNARQIQLWEKLDLYWQHPELTTAEVLDTWTRQMGYPVVNVMRNGDEMTVSQERFLLFESDMPGEESPLNPPYKWYVPLSYTYAGGDFENTTLSEYWLEPNDTERVFPLVDVPDESALIVNVRQKGFYRVKYDQGNYDKITQTLLTDLKAIHPINRGQVLNDALSLARGAHLDYETALNTTLYLRDETEYIPWRAGLEAYAYVRLMLRSTAANADMSAVLRHKMELIYESLEFNPPEDEDEENYLDGLLRLLVVDAMCQLGYSDCVSRSTSLFRNWRGLAAGEPNPIHPSLKATVYCTAIREGGSSDWDYLWNQYLTTTNANEAVIIYYALGCSTNTDTLRVYLDMILDPNSEVRIQDANLVFSSVATNGVGNEVAWNWMRERWPEIHVMLDTAIASPVASMVSTVTAPFNTELQLQELEDFAQDNNQQLGTARQATLNAIEQTKANVKWVADYYAIIEEWAADNAPEGGAVGPGGGAERSAASAIASVLAAAVLYAVLN